MIYTLDYLKELLKTEPLTWEPEEYYDIGRALQSLSFLHLHFILLVLQGYSLREAGKKVNHPKNTGRLYSYVCTHILKELGGSNA